jgi:hypothetical protein
MKIHTLVLSTLISVAAKAETKIVCQFDSVFSVTISAGDLIVVESDMLPSKKALAKIVLSGPRLYEQITGILVKDIIATRVHYGTSYFVDPGNKQTISLQNIVYAAHSSEGDLGFKGEYKSGGQTHNLSCAYQTL